MYSHPFELLGTAEGQSTSAEPGGEEERGGGGEKGVNEVG